VSKHLRRKEAGEFCYPNTDAEINPMKVEGYKSGLTELLNSAVYYSHSTNLILILSLYCDVILLKIQTPYESKL
jgi:hypothetical protein